MSNIFNLGDLNDFSDKINLDELYIKKQNHDLRQLEIFNKLLNRIHNKIKLTSRQKLQEQWCWYLIPEIMIGVPKYDQGACIGYILNKLKTNGFICKYIHPNVIFISWKHWIPSYVRNELKKKSGINIDGFGKITKEEEKKDKTLQLSNKSKNNNLFKSIGDYKPNQNIVYNQSVLNKIDKLSERR